MPFDISCKRIVLNKSKRPSYCLCTMSIVHICNSISKSKSFIHKYYILHTYIHKSICKVIWNCTYIYYNTLDHTYAEMKILTIKMTHYEFQNKYFDIFFSFGRGISNISAFSRSFVQSDPNVTLRFLLRSLWLYCMELALNPIVHITNTTFCVLPEALFIHIPFGLVCTRYQF